MDFADEAALEAYQVHPEHRRFLADIIGPIVEDKQVLDYRDAVEPCAVLGADKKLRTPPRTQRAR